MERDAQRPVGLDHLPEGATATVTGLVVPDPATDSPVALRLLELGFVPGERVRVLRKGRSNASPLAVRVGHSTFALRRHEAALIQVRPS